MVVVCEPDVKFNAARHHRSSATGAVPNHLLCYCWYNVPSNPRATYVIVHLGIASRRSFSHLTEPIAGGRWWLVYDKAGHESRSIVVNQGLTLVAILGANLIKLTVDSISLFRSTCDN